MLDVVMNQLYEIYILMINTFVLQQQVILLRCLLQNLTNIQFLFCIKMLSDFNGKEAIITFFLNNPTLNAYNFYAENIIEQG